MTPAVRVRTLLARAIAAGLFRSRVAGRALLVTAAIRIAAGLIFISAGIPKITAHKEEVRSFGTFGLPESSSLVYLVAAIEIGGGLLLLLGLLTRLTALALAGNMAGAILTAGTHVGGPIHLGLAPALLASMVYLLWAGPGVPALDQRWPAAP